MTSKNVGILGAQRRERRRLASALAQAAGGLRATELASVGEAEACQIVLLMGLDLATSTPEELQEDTELRRGLAAAGISFHVVYGTAEARLESAQLAIARGLNAATNSPGNTVAAVAQSKTISREPWQWSCDKCSDPACEHRLFSGLVGREDSI